MKPSKPIQPTKRTRELAAIHVSAKKLGMDRGTYEAMLMRLCGVRSSADLSQGGRAKVLDELRRLGAPKNPNEGRPANFDAQPMLQKIGALLAEIQAPWSYADGIAKRMYGVVFVAWLRKPEQLRGVIAALDARKRKLSDIDALPAARPRRARANPQTERTGDTH